MRIKTFGALYKMMTSHENDLYFSFSLFRVLSFYFTFSNLGFLKRFWFLLCTKPKLIGTVILPLRVLSHAPVHDKRPLPEFLCVTSIVICYWYRVILFSCNFPFLSLILNFLITTENFWLVLLIIFYLRNRKHVPCFYRAIETRVEVWQTEKCCANTSRRRVFPQLFRVLPFTSVSITR